MEQKGIRPRVLRSAELRADGTCPVDPSRPNRECLILRFLNSAGVPGHVIRNVDELDRAEPSDVVMHGF
jgi:hypothetical protein